MSRLTLLEENKEINYKVYRSSEIEENKDELIKQIESSRNTLRNVFPEADSSWSYPVYNLFSISGGFPMFWNLYKDLQFIVRDYLNTDEPLWLQCWANYQWPNEVFDWHYHKGWECHGYISIEPHNTKTIFDGGVEIDNKPGNIYIGESDRFHKIYLNENYTTARITCGYDIATVESLKEVREKDAINLSLIPI